MARSQAAHDELEQILHDELAALHAFLTVRHKDLLTSLRRRAAALGPGEAAVSSGGIQGAGGGVGWPLASVPLEDIRPVLAVVEPQASGLAPKSLPTTPSFESGSESPQASGLPRRTSKTNAAFRRAPAKEHNGRLHRLVDHPIFETVFIMLIVVNALVMATEAQYHGLCMGFNMAYPGHDRDGPEVWPYAESGFRICGVVFGCVFTFELIMKILGLRENFLCSLWNVFDLIIITFWLLTEALQLDIPLNPMIFRLFRLAKLMRLVRILKFVKSLDVLQLIMGSILASGSILVWSTLILSFGFMTCSIALNYLLFDYMSDPSNDQNVFKYFGTFTRSMLTMFEITLGNWIPACRTLMESVSEWYMLFFLIYKVSVGFAVIKVITGVFMHETFQVASADDELMISQKERLVKKHTSKMHSLFDELDDSGDGMLTIEEFRKVVNDRRVKLWLSAMELDVIDSDTLFRLIDHPDDGESLLSAEELVAGVGRLKGSARRLDMEVLHGDVKELNQILGAHVPEMRLELANLRRETQSLCGYVVHLESSLAGHAPRSPLPRHGSGASLGPSRRPAEAAELRSRSPPTTSRSPGHDPSDVAKRIGQAARRGENSTPRAAAGGRLELAAVAASSGSGQPRLAPEPSEVGTMDEML